LRGEVIYSRYDLHDYSVPELELHLHGAHGPGPALWTPQVELGRPAIHTGGLSQAYWLCQLLALGIDDAWELHGALVLATLVLGGFFAWGFFRALELHPWSAAACALGFAFASFHGHVGSEILFVSGSVWSMGLAWALVANLRRPSLANGLALAFVVHSAILAAYPQQLVLAAWFELGLLVALWPPRGERRRRLVQLALFGALGVACASPFLLDLVEKAADSQRPVQIPLVPHLSSVRDALAWLQELGDPLWHGRPPFVHPSHHLWGVTFTPLFGAGLVLAVARVRTRLVHLALGFTLALLALTLSEPLYRFGVGCLGLGLSHLLPFAGATVPIALLGALGFDHALRRPRPSGEATSWIRGAWALVLPTLIVAGALATGRPLDPWNASVSLALAAAAAWALARSSGPVLLGAALVAAAHYGVANLPVKPRAEIDWLLEHQAPRADEIRRLAGEGRFAQIASRAPGWPAPNMELLHRLASIHSYDALPSQRFKTWVRGFGGGTTSRERIFNYVADPSWIASEDFARSGVRVVLSEQELSSPALRAVGELLDVHLYEVVSPAPLRAWVPLSACRLATDKGSVEVSVPGSIASVGKPIERRSDRDERFQLAFAAEPEPGLVWLSQQYHPRWRATSRGRPLTTLPVDGFWQGVLVPPGTSELTLEFRPWIRWWWVPQLFFALAAVGALLARSVRSRQSSAQRQRATARAERRIHAGTRC
jgi:hypothetical protein